MASVYIYPMYHNPSRSHLMVQQTGLAMQSGERFPRTHDINVQIPPDYVQTPTTSYAAWYGTTDRMSLNFSLVRDTFWDLSVMTDFLEDRLSGRITLIETDRHRWEMGFSRPDQRVVFTRWLDARLADPFFPVEITSPERHQEVIAWMNSHRTGDALYFGANPPGLETRFPQRVGIENPDTAFAFKMRFVGEQGVEQS